MTVFNYAQLEAIWIQANGNPQAAAWAAAVAEAESGGDSQAHSPSNDVGLWQINATYHPPSQATYDVMGNARAAVAISGNGSDWGAWCTAWAQPAGNCGHHLGPTPQAGSQAARRYQGNIPPDGSAPINATNAAANNTSGNAPAPSKPQGCGVLDWINPFTAGACAVETAAAPIVSMVVGTVLNPLINFTAGVMGIGAGGALMIAGVWALASQTRAGQAIQRTGLTAGALAAGQPELAAGGIGGVARAQAGQRRFAARSGVIEQRQAAQQAGIRQTVTTRESAIAGRVASEQQTRTAAQEQRLRATTREQLRREAAIYQMRQRRRQPQ